MNTVQGSVLRLSPVLAPFIAEESQRLIRSGGPAWSLSVSQLDRYARFVDIAVARYEETAEQLRAASVAAEHARTRGVISDEVQQAHHVLASTATVVTHEIECFYLFAQILLDECSRFAWRYFGEAQGKGCSLNSHRDLTNNFDRYVSDRKLTILPARLSVLAKELLTDLTDFRDKQIAHAKSFVRRGIEHAPKSDRSSAVLTTTPLDDSSIGVTRTSRIPSEFVVLLNEYLSGFTRYVLDNKAHCRITVSKRRRSAGEKE